MVMLVVEALTSLKKCLCKKEWMIVKKLFVGRRSERYVTKTV